MEQQQQEEHVNTRRQLTFEEQQTLKQCGKEAKLYRGFPLALATATGMFYLKGLGYIQPQRFIIKVISGGVFSYFVGMLSYFKVCRNRVLQLPNSPLAEELRRGVGAPEAQQQVIRDMTAPEIGAMSMLHKDNSTYPGIIADESDYSTATKDVLDAVTKQEDKHYTSYDELRRRNREEFLQKMRPSGYPTQPSYKKVEAVVAYPSSISEIEGKPVLTKYGDSDYSTSFK